MTTIPFNLFFIWALSIREATHDQVSCNIKTAQAKQKRGYKNCHSNLVSTSNIGSKVLLQNQMGKEKSSKMELNSLACTLSKPLPKLVFVVSSINKVKLYARNTTSLYWNYSSLKIQQKLMNTDSYKKTIIMKNTINKNKRRSIYTMKHTMNTNKICTNWTATTSTNFLTKSLKWFYLLQENHDSKH